MLRTKILIEVYSFLGRDILPILVVKDEDNSVDFNMENLRHILRNPEYEKHYVAIFSMIGPQRAGKSFFLSLLKNYHSHRQQVTCILLKCLIESCCF